jgi:hypothetical protein
MSQENVELLRWVAAMANKGDMAGAFLYGRPATVERLAANGAGSPSCVPVLAPLQEPLQGVGRLRSF